MTEPQPRTVTLERHLLLLLLFNQCIVLGVAIAAVVMILTSRGAL